MKRRDFIRTGSLALAALAAAGIPHPARPATRLPLGRIREMSGSLAAAGILKGDLTLTALSLGTDAWREGDLCAAFTAEGNLLLRFVRTDGQGNFRLSRGPGEQKFYAPDAVVIFGPVVRVERDGRPVAALLNLRDFPEPEGGAA